ncbi:extracellular solute-binding protein [Devosia submarina]|uniref:extracellular solute-binding protein n=1 Tax=Devosia submarina TaxID=1173082 RepID=UPI000D346005|nr:extracellular solute-binding protein [Devosia submarina]
MTHRPADTTKTPFRLLARRAASLALATALTTTTAMGGYAQDITFWTQPQGDLLAYQDMFDTLTSEFREQSGINVSVEVINWSVAFNTWLTVAQGGAAPDCADMYWLHSFSGIGAGRFGPMPITQYKDQWPTLEEDFYEGALVDVHRNGEFYGIPWRVDIRPMMYRTDFLQEAGIDAPPDNWEQIVEQGLKLTQRDANGNVTRWGFALGANNNPGQTLMPYYWQAGGAMMTEDGRTATIDNDAMRTTLKFMQDLVHVHKITSPEIFEKSADPLADFTSGTVAIVGSTNNSWPSQFDRDYPELEGTWALEINPAGPTGERDSFSGAGYWGVLYGSKDVDACIDWIKFLSTPENMERISEVTGAASPRRSVMTSELWTQKPWQAVMAETLNYGHTSQHPSAVWNAIASPEPGAVLYDLVYNTVIGGGDIDAAVTEAQARMQTELDRANAS